jgi:hypothetical protein
MVMNVKSVFLGTSAAETGMMVDPWSIHVRRRIWRTHALAVSTMSTTRRSGCPLVTRAFLPKLKGQAMKDWRESQDQKQRNRRVNPTRTDRVREGRCRIDVSPTGPAVLPSSSNEAQH